MLPLTLIQIATTIVARAAAAKALAAHVLAAMLVLAPPSAPRHQPESEASVMERYRGIADAIALAAVTPRGREVTVGESEGQRRAAVLIGLARHESGPFERDVDVGPCRTAAAACDGGRSVSVWQVMTHTAEQRHSYRTDRYAAADAAMRIALTSEARCRGTDEERYGIYSSGACDRGRKAARELRQYVAHAHAVLAREVARASDPYAE